MINVIFSTPFHLQLIVYHLQSRERKLQHGEERLKMKNINIFLEW